MQPPPDIDKMRKFSLVAAVVLIAYIGAVIELDPNAQVPILGVPFVVKKPSLLPAMLAASIFGLFRFVYYATMREKSPYRRREEVLSKLLHYGGIGLARVKDCPYWGPSSYTTTPSFRDKTEVDKQAEEVKAAFPSFGKHSVIAKITHSQQFDEVEGEPYYLYSAEVTIPAWCRFAAFLEDVDYMAPIWANLLAWGWLGISWL